HPVDIPALARLERRAAAASALEVVVLNRIDLVRVGGEIPGCIRDARLDDELEPPVRRRNDGRRRADNRDRREGLERGELLRRSDNQEPRRERQELPVG